MDKILLDTCVVRHGLSKKAREITPALVARLTTELSEGPHFSDVTIYELDRWLQLQRLRGRGQQQARLLAMILADATLYEMSAPVWRLAAVMHAEAAVKNITFGEADLMILATAVVHNRRVLTTDVQFASNALAAGTGASVELIALA